jgi:L,D-peptidoglycan transpeptidase YkuD (ErfK/YbiS/YcfS/YnhG family)
MDRRPVGRRQRLYAPWLAALLCAATLVACTKPARSTPAPASAAAVSSATTASVPASSPADATPPPSVPVSAAPSTSTAPVIATPTPTITAKAKPTVPVVPQAAPSATPTQPLLVTQLASVGSAQQVVIVTSQGSATSIATLQTFEKDAAGWRAVFPAMPAIIGRGGFSSNRTEGDGTTPTGKYSFGTMFGQQANPGVKFPYRVPDAQSVWVGDSASPYYNTWQEDASLVGEHLASSAFSKPYAYAVAINFNTAPVVPHKGSAIFLHVRTGSGTAGCVSISQPSLLQVLRWLDPARAPVIVMGPTSVIRQY